MMNTTYLEAVELLRTIYHTQVSIYDAEAGTRNAEESDDEEVTVGSVSRLIMELRFSTELSLLDPVVMESWWEFIDRFDHLRRFIQDITPMFCMAFDHRVDGKSTLSTLMREVAVSFDDLLDVNEEDIYRSDLTLRATSRSNDIYECFVKNRWFFIMTLLTIHINGFIRHGQRGNK